MLFVDNNQVTFDWLQVITQEEANWREKRNGNKEEKDFLFSVGNGILVDGSRFGNRAKYVNHSCQVVK